MRGNGACGAVALPRVMEQVGMIAVDARSGRMGSEPMQCFSNASTGMGSEPILQVCPREGAGTTYETIKGER